MSVKMVKTKAKAKTKKQNKRLSPLAIILAVAALLLVIGLVIIFVVSKPNNEPKETYITPEWAEEQRLDAIADQIRIKAEMYHRDHGVWPESLDDIHESSDRLPDLVFNSFARHGFITSYIGVNGERIIYCSEDFAKTSMGQKNCPRY